MLTLNPGDRDVLCDESKQRCMHVIVLQGHDRGGRGSGPDHVCSTYTSNITTRTLHDTK